MRVLQRSLTTTLKQTRLYYGWVMVVGLAITETVSYGVLFYAFTVFLTPMQAELGWSSGEITGAYALGTIVAALAGIPLGRWLDRHGARGMMTLGAIIGTGLVLAWSQVTRLEAFYAIWFGLGIAKAMVLYDPAFWMVATWFIRKRRRALTLMTFIAGFSSFIFTPLAQALVSQHGWRDALVIYALVLGIITIPIHALLLRRRPSDIGLYPDGDSAPIDDALITTTPTPHKSDALRQPRFWGLVAAFTLNALATSVILIHLVPYLKEAGYEAQFAATVYGLIGLLSLPGRIVFTPLGDRYPPIMIAAALFLTQAIGLGVLGIASGTGWVVAFLLLFSLGYGAITPARAALVAELFGAANYGSVSSVMAMVVMLTGAFAPVIAGIAHDQLGSYDGIMPVLALISLLASVAMLLITRERRKETGTGLIAAYAVKIADQNGGKSHHG